MAEPASRTRGAAARGGVAPTGASGPADAAAPSGAAPAGASGARGVAAPAVARAAPELVLMALAVIMFVQAGNFAYVPRPGQLGPDFWPRAVTVGLFVACAVRLVQKLAGRDARPRRDEQAVPMDRRWLTIGIALAIGYAAGTVVIGYLLATATFLTIFLWVGGQRRWFVPPLAAAASVAFSYVFLKLVYVSLPTGWGAFDDFTVTVYQWLGIF